MDVLRTLDRQLDAFLGLLLPNGKGFDNSQGSRDRQKEMEKGVDINALTPGHCYSFIVHGRPHTMYFVCELQKDSLVFSFSAEAQIDSSNTLVVKKGGISGITAADVNSISN
jgi:hypothetical protein